MNNLTIIPRGKHILVKPDDEESRVSKSGLVKPGNIEQERKSVGTVIEIGSEIEDIKKDDKVIYGTYAGDEVQLNDVEYKLIHEEYILAFLKEQS